MSKGEQAGRSHHRRHLTAQDALQSKQEIDLQQELLHYRPYEGIPRMPQKRRRAMEPV